MYAVHAESDPELEFEDEQVDAVYGLGFRVSGFGFRVSGSKY
jgi:hypothetical protein